MCAARYFNWKRLNTKRIASDKRNTNRIIKTRMKRSKINLIKKLFLLSVYIKRDILCYCWTYIMHKHIVFFCVFFSFFISICTNKIKTNFQPTQNAFKIILYNTFAIEKKKLFLWIVNIWIWNAIKMIEKANSITSDKSV